jgi:hypothetical protein
MLSVEHLLRRLLREWWMLVVERLLMTRWLVDVGCRASVANC